MRMVSSERLARGAFVDRLPRTRWSAGSRAYFVRATWSLLLVVIVPYVGTTEQDAHMARDASNWYSIAQHFQQSAQLVPALRAATTCIRLGPLHGAATIAKCHTLLGTLLAVEFRRDPHALVHFMRAAEFQPSLETYSNVGLAMSRLYLNDLSGDWYERALDFQPGLCFGLSLFRTSRNPWQSLKDVLRSQREKTDRTCAMVSVRNKCMGRHFAPLSRSAAGGMQRLGRP